MPVYEFRCPDCNEFFDRLLPRDAAGPNCPSCGSENVRRLISLIGGVHRSGDRTRSTSGGCACGGACACSS